MSKENLPLKLKQALFVDEYMIDFNATRAAIRAGYSAESATVIGSENLRKPYIKAALDARIADRIRRTEITQDKVIKEIARIGFFDAGKLFNQDGSLKNINDVDEDTRACISGIEIVKNKSDQILKYKITDKNAALEKLCKHLGMYASEKKEIEISANETTPIIITRVIDSNE